jgi:hypothetical protein
MQSLTTSNEHSSRMTDDEPFRMTGLPPPAPPRSTAALRRQKSHFDQIYYRRRLPLSTATTHHQNFFHDLRISTKIWYDLTHKSAHTYRNYEEIKDHGRFCGTHVLIHPTNTFVSSDRRISIKSQQACRGSSESDTNCYTRAH